MADQLTPEIVNTIEKLVARIERIRNTPREAAFAMADQLTPEIVNTIEKLVARIERIRNTPREAAFAMTEVPLVAKALRMAPDWLRSWLAWGSADDDLDPEDYRFLLGCEIDIVELEGPELLKAGDATDLHAVLEVHERVEGQHVEGRGFGPLWRRQKEMHRL